MTNEEKAAVLAAAARTLAEGEAVLARAEADAQVRAARWPFDEPLYAPPPPRRPQDPGFTPTGVKPDLSDYERRRLDRWHARAARKDPPRPARPAPAFSKVAVGAIAEVLAAEREAMRRHVAAELASLKDEIAALRAELGVRRELEQLQQQMSVIRSDRSRVIDVPALPKRGAA